LAALERLGLRGELEALCHRIDRLHGTPATGTTIFDLAYGDLDPTLHPSGVHRGALHQLLWSAFERSGAQLETGRTIVAVDRRSGDRATLVDDNGRALPVADLRHRRIRFALAAACAGRAPKATLVCVWCGLGNGAGYRHRATHTHTHTHTHTQAQRCVGARIVIGYLPVGHLTGGGSALTAFFRSLKPDDYHCLAGRFRRLAGTRRNAVAATIAGVGRDLLSC
jgi:hypothetical protein